MIHYTGISKHTRTRHKFLARCKVPTTIVKYFRGEIHLCWCKSGIVYIIRISNTSGRIRGSFNQVISEQIVSLFWSNTRSIRFAAVISSCTCIRERGIIIYSSYYNISIGINTICSNIHERLAICFANRISRCTLTNYCANNTSWKSCCNFYFNTVSNRYIYRLRCELFHGFWFVYHNSICLVTVVNTLSCIRKCCIVISSGCRFSFINQRSRCLNICYQFTIKLIFRIVCCLSSNDCTFHSAKCLVIYDSIIWKSRSNSYYAILSYNIKCQHVRRFNTAKEVSIFPKDQIFFCHFEFSPFDLRISYDCTNQFTAGIKSFYSSCYFRTSSTF